MNRKIKFRFWHTETKVMLDWNNIAVQGEHSIGYLFGYGTLDRMQYTDLKDKNGKEIYEGDIISCYGYKAIIKFGFHESYNGWYAETEDGVICELNKTFEVAEVIGNAYENPELLKEANTDLDKRKGKRVAVTVECPHCDNAHDLIEEEMNELGVVGKAVVNCEWCDKLYTVRQDDEVYYTS